VLTRISPILVGKYELVTTTDRLLWWEDQIRRQGICAFDTETTGLDPHTAELVGIALALPSGEACYVPVGHQGVEQLPLPTVLNVLGPVLSMPLITKVMQNAKYDLHVMARYGIEVADVEDTMLKSYSLFGGKHRHNMDDLARMYLKWFRSGSTSRQAMPKTRKPSSPSRASVA
jgi:DNA polymerase-1